MAAADPGCVFCKIVAGEIPAARVFEDDDVLAFLDVGPLSKGHLLLIPKSHAATIDEMSADAVATLTRHLPRLARAVRQLVDAEGVNVLQNNGRCAGQSVDHVHFHLIPRVTGDGLGYRWNAGAYQADELERIRNDLSALLESD